MLENFVDHHLNTVVKHSTGNNHFSDKHQMDCNTMGIYFGDINKKNIQRKRIKVGKQVNINLCFVETFIRTSSNGIDL